MLANTTHARSVLLDGSSPPRAKIGDFGVSLLAGALQNNEEVMDGAIKSLGTPRYQAPEVSNAVAHTDMKTMAHELLAILDTRSDVYSYGCLLYELLHGRVVMEKTSAICAMIKTLGGERSELALRPEHAHLATMIEQCWHADPDRRMQLQDVVAQLSTMLSTASTMAGRERENAVEGSPTHTEIECALGGTLEKFNPEYF